ncbi:Zinc finger CCHC domain-containing protein [Trichinella spiralis]|uniref:Zinc finger CCHC domain-containing protein n=1 Tax=Trichinella spiralis TaxID=6334 RepID=A0ABR3KRN8_TRISP
MTNRDAIRRGRPGDGLTAAGCGQCHQSDTTLPASSRKTGTALTLDELKEAERIWIRQEQIHAFSSRESLDKAMTKMLCGLNPFLDEFGVLRVDGRLGRAQLEEETKFPALLPRKGIIVDLLIIREHNRQLHAGVALGKRWASWNPQADERLIDELTYDQRFELRS